MFRTEGLHLDTFRLVVLSVGHHDAKYDNKIFKKHYHLFLEEIRRVNSEVKFIFCLMIPVVWDKELYAVFRNRNKMLRDMGGVDKDRQETEFFLDIYKKL